jgi:hypothetical protein
MRKFRYHIIRKENGTKLSPSIVKTAVIIRTLDLLSDRARAFRPTLFVAQNFPKFSLLNIHSNINNTSK